MISREKINGILEGYDRKKIRVASVCSHSALQIFHGARSQGLKSVGVCTEERKRVYDAFPLGKPDDYIIVDDPREIPYNELVAKDAVLVPHGSLVEYTGKALEEAGVPILGNRLSLLWERDRNKMFEWMKAAGLEMPALVEPDKIDRPCIVKLPGAKGGKGYITVSSSDEFYERVREEDVPDVMVQEYLIGVRAYPHFFYSPLTKDGFRASEGTVELMSVDRRVESNVDESYRSMLAGIDVKLSFSVMGNEPLVLRESLLGEVLGMGRDVVEAADRLFGGIPGPFCIETICDENLQFYAFEISARIVAGTNLFPQGSPYSCYAYKEPMSTGARIALEIKRAAKADKLAKITY